MFTGLIEDLGTVRELRKNADSVRLKVATSIPMGEIELGESIAVNGICLTVVAFGDGMFAADVSPETVYRSTLAALVPGSRVNLERALRLGARLGGHLVSGHVDAVGSVVALVRDGNAQRLTFRLPAEINRYVVEKGSVAIDGISLTVNSVTDDTFSVAIIPHTLAETTLKDRQVGSQVNIETDIIGKYVERLLGRAPREETRSPVDLDFLAKHGFL